MKTIYTLLFLLMTFPSAMIWGQSTENFSVTVEEFSIPGAPGLQSFAWAQANGKWLFIGGRTDGLHLRRPFEAFLSSGNNTGVFVIDPVTEETWATSLSALPVSMAEQLQSTNMEFDQRGNTLYMIGGYGYSATAADHITYEYLTAVKVEETIDAVIAGDPISPYFRQISNPNFAVTGGYLDYLDSTFYLVGGQNFIGRYNPMGPTHGPGFFQEYTDEIRTFKIVDDGTSLLITDYAAIHDSANLHRRDYNMVPQIFPDGARGFTAFSGVFQHTVDLPWLNTVDIRPGTYTVRPGFNQYLNQYHSAHLPIFDELGNAMHTLFFGGIGRYTLDASGYLVDDPDVPFVKTISRVSRWFDDSMDEFKIGEMPDYLGSGAEFIPLSDSLFDGSGILDLNALPPSKVHVGYIFGGIDASMPNFFFSLNDGSQSTASNRLFRVFVDKTPVGVEEDKFSGENLFSLEIYPNPVQDKAEIVFGIPMPDTIRIAIHDLNGKLIEELYHQATNKGSHTVEFNTRNMAKGTYLVTISNDGFSKAIKMLVK